MRFQCSVCLICLIYACLVPNAHVQFEHLHLRHQTMKILGMSIDVYVDVSLKITVYISPSSPSLPSPSQSPRKAARTSTMPSTPRRGKPIDDIMDVFQYVSHVTCSQFHLLILTYRDKSPRERQAFINQLGYVDHLKFYICTNILLDPWV